MWGSSLGGGHAMHVAADDPRIAAAIALAPHVSGPAAAAAAGSTAALRLSLAGVRDYLGSWLRAPHYVPVLAQPGSSRRTDGTRRVRHLRRPVSAPRIRTARSMRVSNATIAWRRGFSYL